MAAPTVFSITYELTWTRAMYRPQTRRVWVLLFPLETAERLNPVLVCLPDLPGYLASSVVS